MAARPFPTLLRLLVLISIVASGVAMTPAPSALAQSAGTALQFNGSNQYVTFGQSAGMTAGLGVQVFTIEAWIKKTGDGATTTTGTGGVTAIPLVAKGRGEADNGDNKDMNYFLGLDTSGRLVADFEECAPAQTGCPAGGAASLNHPATAATSLQNNVWHHVAVTYDGRYWKFYLNGVQDGTTTDVGATRYPRWDSVQHAGIATAMTSTGAAAGFFAGVIDEVRIWNVVRTAAEIHDNEFKELTTGTGLIGRWGLNEGSGTSAANSIPGRPGGTFTNGPTWVEGFPPSDTTAPAAPTGLTAAAASTMVSLDWADNTEADLAGYNIYRGTVSGTYTKANPGLVTASTYVDTGLTNLQEYFYVVRAVDTSGNASPNSNEASSVPMADLGTALQFTDSSAYVTFGDPAKLDLASFTIETWFKRTGNGVAITTGTNGIANAVPLVTHGAQQSEGGTQDANWMLVINDDTDVIAADFEDMTTGGNHPVSGVTPVTLNVWHHAAATWDGSTWRIYLDGKLETSLAVNAIPRSDTTQHAGLGSMLNTTGGTNGFFQGVMDEARVWNRALTQDELLGNINKQLTSGSGLVARWGLNEGSGTTVNDSVSPLASGTVTGSTYAWVPGAPFNLAVAPAAPALVSPADQATGVATSIPLTVHVTDPLNSPMSVSFYGRPKTGSPGPDFSLIAIPDPQYYASSYPAIYNAQMNWVVANKTSSNIPYVVCLGDIVDGSTTTAQWTNATTAWNILTAGGVRYGLALGNHDGAPSATANFNSYFGSRLSSQATFGGRYGTDYDNTYASFSAGGMDFIVLFIEYDISMTSTSNPVLAWANSIMAANPAKRAIVVTHDLLDNSSNFTAQGAAIYGALKGNTNLFLMMGGHLDGSRQRSDVYNGNVVYSLRADYQFVDSQQSGYLRVLRFSPANNKLYVTTYSPNQNKSLTDGTNEFNLNYPMSSSAPFTLIGTANNVPSGTNATVTWSGLLTNTAYEWYAVAGTGGGSTNSATWSFTTGSTANNAPSVTRPNDQTNAEGDAVSLQMVATDLDNDPLSYAANNLPSGLSIGASTGLIAGTISADAASGSPYNVTVTVSDGRGGNTPASFTWTVQPATSRPCGDDPSLVGCWPMDEGSGTTAADGGALPANNATFVGAPTWVAGQSDGAISLNGTSQYGTTPNEASLDIASQITLAAWLKPGKQATQDVIKKAVMDTTDGFELSLASADVSSPAPKKVFVRLNQKTSANTYRVNSQSDYPFDGNTWVHVAATYDGATIRLYINGIEEASLAASVPIATNNLPLSIGAESTGARPFQGAIDEARVYDRALSAAEVAELVGGSQPPSGLSCTDLQTKPATTTTGEKPQSKVWQYDGAWWAVFPTSASGASSSGTWLWRLDGTAWTEILKLSERTDTKADVKVQGDVIHALLYAEVNTQLVSAQYQPSGRTYALWSARPAPSNIALPNSETATIDIDTTGQMWLATRAGDAVPPAIVAYYSNPPYATWGGPVTLDTGIIANDDIAVVTALPALHAVGVLWGNENPAVRRFGFRTHVDGTDPNSWTANEVPASQSAIDGVGAGMADDHFNTAVSSDGTLYVAAKTSYDTPGYPRMAVLVRRPAGTWDDLYGLDESGTRPNMLLDEANGVLSFIYTQSEGNNPIVYRQSSLNPIAFGAKKTLQAGSYNDVSSTKQNYTAELVTIFSNGSVVAGELCRPTGAAPKPPEVTIAKVGNDVKLTWPKVLQDVNNNATTVLRYQAYTSLKPYFRPGDDSAALPDQQVTGLEYTGAGVVPSPGGQYYIMRAANAAGPSTDSKRTGKFTFSLVKGSTP